MQNARKKAGLEVSDRIDAGARAATPSCSTPPAQHEGYVSGETLALSVAYEADGGSEGATIDGRELLISVTRTDEQAEFGPEDFE